MTMKDAQTNQKSDSKWKINIIRDRCKGCGFCIEFCPQNTLRGSDDVNSRGYTYPVLNESGSHCVGCMICEKGCPDLAIFVTKNE